MVRRALVLTVAIAAAVAAQSLLRAPHDDLPVAVVGHTGPSLAVPAAIAPPVTPTTAGDPPATPAPTTARTKVVANRSSTVVRSDKGGATVVNSGSAVASTGGNTVVGPESATVVNGPVTAVGNSSEVRITPP